jgi:5-methylcytosine-specific restriction endonuclease McrA
MLQGDHIWPWSLFGETSWQNYQLICGSCNLKKKDKIDNQIRIILGNGEFRNLVKAYLKSKLPAEKFGERLWKEFMD